MNIDQKLEMELVIDTIKKEKRQKQMQFAGNKNIVNQNREIARNYGEIKDAFMAHLRMSRMQNTERVKINKATQDHDKKMKQLYNSVKRELIFLKREWEKSEDQRAQEKMLFVKSWATTIAVFTLCQEIVEKKRTMRIFKIIQKIRDDNAKIIQRKAKQYLDAPLTLKLSESTTQQVSDNKIRKRVYVYHRALNLSALILRKSKTKRAENSLFKLFLDMITPCTIKNDMEAYLLRIIKLQRRWKHQMEVYKARVKIFMACWNQYCLSLLEEDNKKKKKKYAEEINRIKEQSVVRYARIFVQNKHRAALKAARYFKEDVEDRKNTPKPLQKVSPKPDDSAKKTSTFITATDSGIKEKSDPAKPEAKKKVRFYPSKEEMKEAYDKLLEEALKNLDSPR